ncbi:hypothetical protein [Sphingomonas sp. GB1N7]|uniref:hypothetical protein n=1 Tax=Parasphingomonas caseinilytica TaxID=3096158 RepID=UPI002FC7280A
MGFQISSSAGVSPFGQVGGSKQNRETFSTLMTAAKSGDIETAKAAFKEFTANRKPPADSPLAKLGAAIESGDAAAIKDAGQALQQARKGSKRPAAAPSISTVQPGVTAETAKSARIATPPAISTVQPVGTVEDVPLINVAQRREAQPAISTVQNGGTLDAGYSVNILA